MAEAQMQMEIAELKAEIERQKRYCRAYKVVLEYWQNQNYKANKVLDEVFDILEVKIND